MASGAGFRLIVRRGPQPNQVYEITKDVVTIGRDISNDIVINDPEASRHHTRLTRSGNSYAAEDLDSTNGTFVNGQRVAGAPQVMANGDLLGIGETVTLAFEAVGAGGARATVVGQPRSAGATAPAYAYEDEEETFLQANRALVIGCGGVLVVACCLAAAALLFLPSEVWCTIPIGNQIQFLCVP